MSTINVRCRTCAYYSSTTPSCDYIIITGKVRGCPAGEGCKRYVCNKASEIKRRNSILLPGSFVSSRTILPVPSPKGRVVRRVKQMRMDGSLIKVWTSAHEAAKTLKINIKGIQDAARGKQKSSKGFRWEYVVEDGEKSA